MPQKRTPRGSPPGGQVAGHPDREIASALSLGVRTGEHHVARILAKLGVRTRTTAVSAALTAGIAEPSPSNPS